MSRMFTPMADVIPEGKSGIWSVEHFEVSKAASKFTALRPAEYVPPGTYCRLRCNRAVVMSDTQMEKSSNCMFVHRAKGDVFVAGLGLGMVLIPVLRKDTVKTVTVVEKYPDVIKLVKKPLLETLVPEHAQKLYVIEADIFEWKLPPRNTGQWDTIYFDIWTDICTDNLEDITRLNRKFSRRLRPGGWRGAWMEGELRYRKERERYSGWY